MKTLSLTFRQPVQVTQSRRADTINPTLGYVPGAAVRGAFAAAWITLHGPPEPGHPRREEFIAVFEGGVRFGPLYVDRLPQSLAVLRHKYALTTACTFAEYDAATAADPTGVPSCACGDPLEPAKGQVDDADSLIRRHTSVSVDPSGAAYVGQLFSRDSLRARTVVRGEVVGDDALLAVLAGFDQVSVGGRRTTHGLADVALAPADPIQPELRDDGDLVIRLGSPAVFVDDEGRPMDTPSERELREILGVDARVTHAWSRWGLVGGYHAASGLPKHTEVCVTAGSTYLVHPDSPVTPECIARMVRRGLGLRRHEGFGHLTGSPTLELTPVEEAARAVAAAREREQQERSVASLRSDAELVAELRRWMDGDADAWSRAQALAARDRLQLRGRQLTAFAALPRDVAREFLGTWEVS